MQAVAALAPNCVLTEWYPLGQDVISKEGGKRNAMLGVLEQYGIQPEESIAFGDSENDKDMLRAAGIGVAMGNAAPEVLQRAAYQTVTNGEDGVARFLAQQLGLSC